MGLIDFILNLAGLLLWLNWRAAPSDPLVQFSPATLAGTLKRTGAPRLKRRHYLVALAGLILLRALLYWQIGSAVGWTASLKLVAISIWFRSDYFSRMLLYSIGSFAVTLVVFYFWLLFLSLVSRRAAETDPFQKLARLQLGIVNGWPLPVKLLLPFLFGGVVWWVLSWPLTWWGFIPSPVSQVHRIEQAATIGLGSYLVWKYLIAAFLVLHMVNSYIYLGNHPFWNFVNSTARDLMSPLRRLPLRVARVDFVPVVGIALVFLAAGLVEGGLVKLYGALPF